MRKIATITILILILSNISLAQYDSVPPRNIIYDTIMYGYDCYSFNDPGIIFQDYFSGGWEISYATEYDSLGRLIFYDRLDTSYILQQYAECREIYGIAMNFDICPLYGTSQREGYNLPLALSALDISAVLYVSRTDGTMEKIDSVQWDVYTPYKFFRYYPPLSYFDISVGICELYFNSPHTIATTDTAWVGLEIKPNKGLDSCPNQFLIYMYLHTAKGNPGYKWKTHGLILYADRTDMWGGVFPITCPKPEGPVEDTVDNGIRDVSYLNSNISIYPNPATDFITINCDNMQNAVIYNSLGQQTLSFTTNKADISTLPNGIYFLKVFTPSNILTRKLVIQK